MKFLRIHITKYILACLIWAGMGLYLAQPVRAISSRSFTNWLESVVKNDHTGDIQKQIYRLKESDGSLSSLIEKASEIVSDHNDGFDLPIGDQTPDSREVYHLLVDQWNSYQTGNGMGKATNILTVKPTLHLQPSPDKLFHSGRLACAAHSIPILSAAAGWGDRQVPVVPHLVEPLSSGIAIGAP